MGQILTNELDKTFKFIAVWHKQKKVKNLNLKKEDTKD